MKCCECYKKKLKSKTWNIYDRQCLTTTCNVLVFFLYFRVANLLLSLVGVNYCLQVPADTVLSVFFPIVPKSLGEVAITVTARSAEHADGLTKQLRVEVSVYGAL